ncbi:hypothetical protein [Bradyrhizobium genosp. P]|uniref:hypothetical protein n=1 Tax=Bradyrhizobium genosp. P TaxID=83641 RepID=UPI003CFB302D
MTYEPNDPYRANMTDDEIRRQARFNSLDNELQPDPELAQGPASGTKIAMFAVAVAVVLGALFYGLNNTSVNQAATTPSTQTAQTQPNPAGAPPGMRDVTPKANSQPGMTTGAAPAQPAAPPASKPTGQDIDRSAAPSNSTGGNKQ